MSHLWLSASHAEPHGDDAACVDEIICHRPSKSLHALEPDSRTTVPAAARPSIDTTMDFAPYQDNAPEQSRALSPPAGPRRSLSRSPNPPKSPPPNARSVTDSALPPPSHFGGQGSYQEDDGGESGLGHGVGSSAASGRAGIDLFETSLPMRMDFEAMMAYLLLPPAGGVLLLVLEHKSDYVRFHAWQSSLLFSAIFIVHLIFSWTAVLSWMLFAVDILLIAFLTFRAYQDADTLDRFEVPFIGRLASSFVDEE